MKKTVAIEIVKDVMLEYLVVAQYRILNSDEYTDEDKSLIIDQLNELGERMIND